MDLRIREQMIEQVPMHYSTGQWTPEGTVASIQRDMEKIHNRLAKRGIHPHQVNPSGNRLEVRPFAWGKVK